MVSQPSATSPAGKAWRTAQAWVLVNASWDCWDCLIPPRICALETLSAPTAETRTADNPFNVLLKGATWRLGHASAEFRYRQVAGSQSFILFLLSTAIECSTSLGCIAFLARREMRAQLSPGQPACVRLVSLPAELKSVTDTATPPHTIQF
jgi:hypothetical protein